MMPRVGGIGQSETDLRRDALEAFTRGDFMACRKAALALLAANGDDLMGLQLAGRAGAEVGTDDAVDYLRRLTELDPEAVENWRELGNALAAEGRTAEAEQAWAHGLEISPRDSALLTALGHSALAVGNRDEAAELLTRASQAEPRNSSATLSLVDIYRDAERLDEALAIARRAWAAEPQNVVVGLDFAELCVATGQLDEARTAYEQLRAIDDEAHELYLLYGLLDVALRLQDWHVGVDVASQAARLDSSLRTARLLAFFAEREFGSLDRSATTAEIWTVMSSRESGVYPIPGIPSERDIPSTDAVERLLHDARTEHRRMHDEERALTD